MLVVRCWILVVLLIVCGLAPPAHAQSAEDGVVVQVENPLPSVRTDEVVSVPWSELRAALDAAGEGPVRVRDAATEEETTVQVLDADGDGQPDALLFLADFRAEERRRFVVEAAAPTRTPEPRAYAVHHEERDDVAWENDRVAFRTYGAGLHALEDLVSSGIDVWLKRVPKLVIDDWYADGHYHTDTGEGADFFSVGETLGAGGTALWRDGQLYRAPNFADHRIVADGPLRAILELEYGPWDAGGISVTERKRIVIDAGEHFFRSESTFHAEGADTLVVATGLVKRPGTVGSMRQSQPWAWLSLWGPVETGSGGHGDLGTAVLLDRERLVEMKETDDHYLALARTAPGEPVEHFVGTGWTATDDFGAVEDWWRHLSAYARALQEPLRVEVLEE